jgi:hypothetical protein
MSERTAPVASSIACLARLGQCGAMKEAVPGWHAQRVAPVVSDPALVLTDLVGLTTAAIALTAAARRWTARDARRSAGRGTSSPGARPP